MPTTHLFTTPASPCIRSLALAALCETNVPQKLLLAMSLPQHLKQSSTHLSAHLDTSVHLQPSPSQAATLPGRPAKPVLQDPAKVPHRTPFTPEGHATLLHAICHIEFNAINLALDAVWRFANMPTAFYADWLQVAAEEAQHFDMLARHLGTLPHPKAGQSWQYGDFAAHDGLWHMCQQTAHDMVARMALVPRTLEARGLDATPLIQHKLKQAAQQAHHQPAHQVALQTTDRLLDTILHDEIGHVAIGNRWYGWLCQQQQLDPIAHYRHLSRQYHAPRVKPPINQWAREQAGFSHTELLYLMADGTDAPPPAHE